MANSDSERKPDDKEQRPRVSGTTYDWARIILTVGTVWFAVLAVATAIGNKYFPIIDPILSAVLAVLFGYLVYHLGRKPKQVGQDFNL